MKELSIEEKAKAYDEAIERAKDYKNDTIHRPLKVGENIMDYIFPELKESEGEGIRKALIKYYSFDKDGGSHALDNITPEQIVTWLEKQGEQKPADVRTTGYLHVEDVEQKPAWSEEDEKMLNDILMCGEHHCYLDAGNITWLKSIKDKVQPQQKQEWSEEDSPYYDDICEILINLLRSETANVNKTAVQKDLDWLNSLKPHNTWKPSEEQMKTLEHFVRSIGESGYASPYDNNTKLLYLLLSDLKKLKG